MDKWRYNSGLAHLDAKLTPASTGNNNIVFKFNNKNELYRENPDSSILTFRELESFTRFLLSEFLTLNHSRVSC
jgi:hypothetical protein